MKCRGCVEYALSGRERKEMRYMGCAQRVQGICRWGCKDGREVSEKRRTRAKFSLFWNEKK
jgi:hypothetical protein